MGALEAQGNIAEGLRVFDRLRGLLREELGTNPSPEALAACERLLHPEGADAGFASTAGEALRLALPAELAPLRGSRLVGRETELERLQTWWEAPGAERVMTVAGEAGIGKSRLLAELARRVHEAGAVVLAGRAPEETLTPYQPLLEAIGHFAFTAPLPELRAATRRAGADLGRLIPELRRRLPDLGDPEPGDPETDRYRLFEAVAGLLGELAGRGPLLLVLDDLQWADRPTLLLLRHLARSPQATGLRILGAHRSGEAAAAFDAALAGLRHERLVSELELRGLAEAATTELVRQGALGTPSSAFAHAIYAGTEGNPFFVEEIVRHLADSGVRPEEAGAWELQRFGLPEGVRGVLARRLERLDDDGRECLRVAAVIGRDFDSRLVEQIAGLDEDRFLQALEGALDAGLVCESPGEPGRYTFAHALVRETLYEGMSSSRRARLHRRVGLALERRGDAPTGALAHHFTRADEAEDAERAIRYALAAGEQAAGMLAHEEAAEHYARALEVLERFDPGEDQRRCELLLELGEARVRSGERPRAWGILREAATLAGRLGDAELMARAAIGASRRFIQPPGVVDSELIALLEQALAMTPAEESLTRVRLITRLCGALYYSDERREQMRRLSAEATTLAAHTGEPEAAALAAAARRRAYWSPGHLERRLSDSTQLLRFAREAGDLELTLQGHAWLVVDLLETGDRTAVEAQVDAFAAGAERLRQPLFLWTVAVWRTMLALLDGRLEEADRLATDALSSGIMPEGVTAPQYHAIQLLTIRREQARMAELEDAARRLVADTPNRLGYRAALGVLLADTDRPDEARLHVRRLAATYHEIPRDGDWIVTTTLLADTAAEIGDEQTAAQLYELLGPHADANVVIGYGAACFGPVSRYLGRLALTIGRRDEAIDHLRRALDASAGLRGPILLAHARIDLAAALGSGTEARELIEQAAAVASELELPRVARRADALTSLRGG
jgi:tetratricopeptide (TPR) repeat protein